MFNVSKIDTIGDNLSNIDSEGKVDKQDDDPTLPYIECSMIRCTKIAFLIVLNASALFHELLGWNVMHSIFIYQTNASLFLDIFVEI